MAGRWPADDCRSLIGYSSWAGPAEVHVQTPEHIGPDRPGHIRAHPFTATARPMVASVIVGNDPHRLRDGSSPFGRSWTAPAIRHPPSSAVSKRASRIPRKAPVRRSLGESVRLRQEGRRPIRSQLSALDRGRTQALWSAEIHHAKPATSHLVTLPASFHSYIRRGRSSAVSGEVLRYRRGDGRC